jgi:hypothetical protein
MAKIIEPVVFPIIPADRGKNTSRPPQSIDMKESPELMNVRIYHGQIATRDGFKSKYYGGWEPILHIDVGYSADGTSSSVVALGMTKLWQSQTAGPMIPILIYDDGGALMDLDTDEGTMLYSVDIGQGTYDCKTINATGMFPAAGYGNVLVFTNQNDGVFVIITGSDGTPLIGEQIDDAGGVGLAGARAVAIFDNRIVVLGSSNNAAEVLWSVSGEFEEFDPAADPSAGAKLLGDGADWGQALMRMGEYIIAYKERSIHIGRKSFKTDPAIEFDPAPGQGIGLAAPASIGDLGEEHIFLGWDDVYVFSLKGIEGIGERVPTGRFPECENLLQRGDCAFVRTTGDTHTNTTIDDIAAADWTLIRLNDVVTGSGVPANTVVVAKAVSGTVTISAATTSSLNDTELWFGNPAAQPWIEYTGGTATWVAKAGGNFGEIYQEMIATVGKVVLYQDHVYGSLQGAGNEISLLVWAKTEHTTTRQMKIAVTERDVGGVLGTTHSKTYTIMANESDWTPYLLSFTSVDADMQSLRAEIGGETVDAKLHLDAVQLTDLTTVDVTKIYSDPATGYQAPGVQDPDGVVQMIPFIAGACGPWTCDTVWVYNYVADAWTCWRLPLTGFGYDVLSTTLTIADLEGTIEEQTWRFDDKLLEAFAPTNLLGEVDGQIYESSGAWGTDFEGLMSRAVLCWWESKDFDLGRPHLDKTYSRLIIHHEVSHFPTELIVGISTDSGANWGEQTVTIRTGYTKTFADFFVTGSQGRFKVRADANGVRISGFTIKIIPRGEANALD